MARQERTRVLNAPKLYMLCEGQTEEYYFKHLAKRLNITCKLDFKKSRLPMHITDIERTLSKEEDNEEMKFICVFDLDVTRSDRKQKEAFFTLKNRQKTQSNIGLCYSMPSIEYWFLLHFKDTNKYFENATNLLHELQKVFDIFEKEQQSLEKEDWVEVLEQTRHQAMQRAKKYIEEEGSFTTVHLFFNFIETQCKKTL